MKTVHPTLEELSRIGYGFEPSPEHVEYCVECLETLRRLRLERDVLVRGSSASGSRNAVSAFLSRLILHRE
jgi:hypothetical protein